MRLNSERLPNKLLATVCGKSLVEIMVCKLLRLREQLRGRITVALVLCAEDIALVEIAERLKCPVIDRSRRSRDGETHDDIYGGLRDVLTERGYQRLIVINPCFPFLRTKTIAGFVSRETEDLERFHYPRVAVLRHRGWVWDQDFQLIHGVQTPNTKRNAPFFTLAHAMFSYPVGVLGMPQQMEFRHFAPYDPSPEFIDIDTESDLQFARTYADGLLQSKGCIDWAD